MTKPLHQPNRIVSISEAAQVLGVSLDTIRRWDKTGLLHSERPDGKNRYFRIDELKNFKLNQPLSISEASYELHVSPTTLRRLVKKDLIKSSRNAAGERVFHKDAIKDFLNSDYYIRRKTSAEFREKTVKKASKTPKQAQKVIEATSSAKIAQSPIDIPLFITKTNWQLVSGVFASAIIFMLLTAIGITNIEISKVEAAQSTKIETVALQSHPFVVPLEPKIGKTKSLLDSVGLIPTKPVEATPGALLRLDVTDDGLTYHIEAATSSADHIATDSATSSYIDAFVIDSIDSKGYHLKLPDGSLGFIPFEKVTNGEVKANE
jgi:excisionase family DNA binding protein